MFRYPPRPLKTYSHRRSRIQPPSETFEACSIIDTSLESSSPNDDDVTLAGLSRMVKKRPTHQAQLSREIENLECMQEDDEVPNPEQARSRIASEQRHDDQAIYETPYISMPKDPSESFYRMNATTPDKLSPVPAARRMLSRIGSRNFKENISRRDDSRCLASPFNSRPGSRVASPDFSSQGPTKRLRLHAKSRTLSSDMSNHSQLPVSAAQRVSAAFQVKPQIVNHNRTASIPVMHSVSLDDLDPHSWLVPPKAFSRSPASIDTQLNDPLHEHPSFYFDVPAGISTPARRNRSMTSIYTDDNPNLGEGNSSVRLVPFISPKPPKRRRRRTIMQAPDDSLFSSMLDFSAYVTDEESPKHIRRSHGLSGVVQELSQLSTRNPGLSDAAHGLGSAFSPSSAPHANDVISGRASPSQEPVRRMLSPQKKELSSLFSSMDIGGELYSPFVALHVQRPDFTLDSVDINKGRDDAMISTTKPAHRRKRGDTIRASDFTRPMVPATDTISSVSNDNITALPKPGPSHNSRRTRSGTVTRENVYETAPRSPGIVERIIPHTKIEPLKHKRRRDNLPHFQRTIHDQPITPQGSDDSDDELLLTGRQCTESASQ